MEFLHVKSVQNVLNLTPLESDSVDVALKNMIFFYLAGYFKVNTQPGCHL